jgi:hypothetical protein
MAFGSDQCGDRYTILDNCFKVARVNDGILFWLSSEEPTINVMIKEKKKKEKTENASPKNKKDQAERSQQRARDKDKEKPKLLGESETEITDETTI